MRRLTRRGGVKRISGLIYEEARGDLKMFLESVRLLLNLVSRHSLHVLPLNASYPELCVIDCS